MARAGAGRRSIRGARWTVLLLSVTSLGLLTACGDSERAPGPARLAPPGSELGDELVVPDGASLVGTRFPGQEEGGWSALLLVEEDPFEVMADLIHQADTSGLTVGASDTRGLACTVHAGTILECNVYARGEEPARTYSLELRWGNDHGASYSHVLVRRDGRTYGYEMPAIRDFGTDLPTTPRLELPPPPTGLADWEPPDVGAEVALTPSWFEPTVVRREPGSFVVSPTGPASCGTGGYTAVLELDEETEALDLVERYVAQFEEFGFDGEITTGTFEEAPFIAAFHGAAGGGDLDAVAVGEQPTFLLLSRCND